MGKIRENASSKFQSSGMIHGLLGTFRRRVLWKKPTRVGFSMITSSRLISNCLDEAKLPEAIFLEIFANLQEGEHMPLVV